MRDHGLRRPLCDAISEAGSDPAAITEAVLQTLDAHHLIQYAPKETLAILTPAGRVLVLLSERPTATLREMSLVLGVTESSVARTVSNLVRSKLIARTKDKGRNIYTFNVDEVRAHPDLYRYHDAVLILLGLPPLDTVRYQ